MASNDNLHTLLAGGRRRLHWRETELLSSFRFWSWLLHA